MQIHWRHAGKLSPAERDHAARHLGELEKGHSDLTDLWVDVASGSEHHRKGNEKVTIRCQARRAEIVATGTHVEAGLALREAIEKFEREVWRLRDKRSEHRRRSEAAPPHLGVVDRIFRDRDYGFILTDGGEQVYFHRNAVGGGLRYDAMEEGQRVALNYEGGAEGLQASVVTRPPADALGSP
jgi:ribosome-associated translation inhibitor RaiA/cold shock CspA family protein